jgi:hypothetical protein
VLTVAPWRHGGSGLKAEWPAGAGNIIEDESGIHKRGTGASSRDRGDAGSHTFAECNRVKRAGGDAGGTVRAVFSRYQFLYLRSVVMWAT